VGLPLEPLLSIDLEMGWLLDLETVWMEYTHVDLRAYYNLECIAHVLTGAWDEHSTLDGHPEDSMPLTLPSQVHKPRI